MALALLLPQPTEACGSPQFERPGLLGTRHVEGAVEAGVRLTAVGRGLLQQQYTFEAMDFWLVPPFAGFVRERQRFCERRESYRWLTHDPIGLREERQKI